jgi:cytochrome c-type biogenesis protein CcmH
MNDKTIKLIIISFGFLFIVTAGLVDAQNRIVTDDDVNAIAKQLYCPVCENIPLDTCSTAACQDWRYEIQLQLENGRTEQEIIDDFVVRFGDRVVGTPQDPFLRALSLTTPFIITILASLGAVYMLLQSQDQKSKTVSDVLDTSEHSTEQYRDLLEQDLSG